jgi:hypothetical protein
MVFGANCSQVVPKFVRGTFALKDRLQGTHELLNLAAKAGQLADQVSRESEGYRIAGRLFRNDIGSDIEAYAELVVYQTKSGISLNGDDPHHFFLLQFFMQIVSYRLWEDLWNDKHPDRFGQAQVGEDGALMAGWRERVRAMINECGQEAVFAMTAEEYVAELIDAGADQDAAENLKDWMSIVMYEEGAPPGLVK